MNTTKFQYIFLSNLNTHTSFVHEIYNGSFKSNITSLKVDYSIEKDDSVSIGNISFRGIRRIINVFLVGSGSHPGFSTFACSCY